MIIESPTLEDCLEMVHGVAHKMATDKSSNLQETTQPASWFSDKLPGWTLNKSA